MTIYRMPVIDFRGEGTGPAPIIHDLPCIGCARQRAAHRSGAFRCPNRGTGPTECAGTSFLYPRLIRDNGEWHFHQGIDVAGLDGVSKIVSVTDGVVEFARRERTEGYSGYGNVVVVRSDSFYYLYAHCATVAVETGDQVRQQQIIATVGRTQYLRNGADSTSTMSPHLHFEVSTARPPHRIETTLDNRTGPRIDPRAHLEELGPWGAKTFFFPLVDGGTDEESYAVTPAGVDRMHAATERDNLGGYYPLGANNIWHGGVHLRAGEGTVVRAPFDAKIVAARLDPDPVRARGAFGSVNFLLLHHELPEAIAQRLRGARAPTRDAWESAVGQYRGSGRRRRAIPNDAAYVVEIKRLLHEAGFYNPDTPALLGDGQPEQRLFDAIVAFQAEFSRAPDGVVDIPGATYRRLQQLAQARQRERDDAAARARGEPEPRPRLVYSLLMHLHPEALDDGLARRFPWLQRLTVEPTDTEREQEQLEREQRQLQIEAELAADGADHDYALTGDVGPDSRRRAPPNHGSDIAWVQRRLARHGSFTGSPDGEWSPALDDAIRRFQTDHVPYYQAPHRRADAAISPTGSTQQTLRMTPGELEAAERDPEAAGARSIDRRFVARATERHADTGLAKVVTGLDVRVSAGEPLWGGGLGFAFTSAGAEPGRRRGVAARATDSSATESVIHWEIFSEEALVGAWDKIDDDRDDDLVVDVPSLINRARADADAAAHPYDEAYDGEDQAPPEDGDPESATAELGEDDVLSVAEIQAFYASERSRFLRTTQCRFTSEWGLNLANTVSALAELGWNTRYLEAMMAPYMWWSEAGDAVPSSPLVWHYNPIAFLELYSQQFPRPPAGPPMSAAPEPEPPEMTAVDPTTQICE